MKKLVLALALAPFLAVSAASDRESSWVIPDLMFLDQDGDGIADQNDACAETTVGKIVASDGCELPVQRVGQSQLNIKFEFNQYRLNESEKSQLAEFADALKRNPDLSIELAGHADFIGSDEYNQKLSERRAQSVAAILINEFEVPSRQLIIVGYSESEPLVVGQSAEARAENRRVQAQLVDPRLSEQFIKTSGSE